MILKLYIRYRVSFCLGASVVTSKIQSDSLWHWGSNFIVICLLSQKGSNNNLHLLGVVQSGREIQPEGKSGPWPFLYGSWAKNGFYVFRCKDTTSPSRSKVVQIAEDIASWPRKPKVFAFWLFRKSLLTLNIEWTDSKKTRVVFQTVWAWAL